nr:RecName: Full=Peptidyl-prolyl cis-trans isomerase; Short=PPIase; AltName: Full=Cyclophilin; AltName: Full=Rotamase [Penicillium glabrum]
KFADENFQLKH